MPERGSDYATPGFKMAMCGRSVALHSGMTQRKAARVLGLGCGSAVSVQVRKLREEGGGRR